MHRLARIIAVYMFLSVLLLPLHLLLVAPRFPGSLAGWLLLVFFPLPLVAVGEWLTRYRSIRVLAPIDRLAVRIEESPYRLAISVTVMLLVGIVAFAGLILLA